MSRVQSRPANPAPAITSTNRPPDTRGISLRPYSYFRPFPNLPEKWQSPQSQAKLLNEYLTHDGHFATFAAQRDLSVDQLYDWLHSEEIVDQRKRLGDMAQERADLLARLARPAAIEALLNLLTNGCMSSNHCRLTASALLRAAAAADRREERAARASDQKEPAAPPTAGSSGRLHPSSPIGAGAAALGGGGGSVSTSSTHPHSPRDSSDAAKPPRLQRSAPRHIAPSLPAATVPPCPSDTPMLRRAGSPIPPSPTHVFPHSATSRPQKPPQPRARP